MTLANGQQPLYASVGNQQSLSGPVGSGDFTNIATNNAVDGVYTLNGTPCAIGDIIDLAHPDGAFDPLTDIDAGGMKRRDLGGGSFADAIIQLKDPLLSQLIDEGFTVVLEGFLPVGVAFNTVTLGLTDDDGAPAPFAAVNEFAIECWSYDEVSDLYIEDDLPTLGAANKFAVTMTAGKQSMSLNGGDVHTHAAPGVGPLLDQVYMAIPGGNADIRLRSFAFYEVVDDADLPALSAL